MNGKLNLNNGSIEPVVFISWPRHIDYPYFRYRLTQLKDRFKKIVIGFAQNIGPNDIAPFLLNALPFVQFDYPPESVSIPDWRQRVMVDLLNNHSPSDWVLFLEQDFLTVDSFWDKALFTGNNDFDFIYYKEDKRIHPAFALIRKKVLFKTDLDFSADPPSYDHFGLFFKQAVEYSFKSADLFSLGFYSPLDFYHLGGLTQNYHAFNLKQPLFKEKEFLAYNHFCRELPIEVPFWFKEIEGKIEREKGKVTNSKILNHFFHQNI